LLLKEDGEGGESGLVGGYGWNLFWGFVGGVCKEGPKTQAKEVESTTLSHRIKLRNEESCRSEIFYTSGVGCKPRYIKNSLLQLL